jgi:uncharacterized membrane protein
MSRWTLVAVAAAIVFFAVYVALDINALHALRATQDTGMYLQMLANFVHSGSLNNNVDVGNHLAYHDSWLVLAVAPVVAVFPRAEALIVVQVLVVASGALVLFALSRDSGAAPAIAGAVAIAYLLSPSIQGFAYGEFRPEQFLPPLAFGLIIAARHRAPLPVIVLTCLMLGIKEDIALFLIWFGLATAVWFDRRIGLILVGLSLLSLCVYYALILALGWKPWVMPLVADPSDWFRQLSFLVEILVPTAFAAFGYRWLAVLLGLPLVAEILLVRLPQITEYRLYRAGDYHTIPLVTAAFAALALLSGSKPTVARYALAGSLVMALFFNTTPLHLGRSLVFSTDAQFPAALSWASTELPVDFPCEDVGAYVVAAADPNARFLPCGGPIRSRPAWKDQPLDSHAAWTKGSDGRR